MNRKLTDVLEQIYNLIPENGNEKDENLSYLMNKLLTSMSYAAPEKILSNYYWKELECIINGIISEEDYYDENNKHYKKIVNILINKN